MEQRRTETVVALLIALAAGAASLSVVITLFGLAPPVRAEIDEPKRTSNPLQWRLADLPPLETHALAIDTGTPVLSQETLRVSMPITAPWGDRSLRAAVGPDPLTTRPLRFRAVVRNRVPQQAVSNPSVVRQRIVVLLPSEPLWRVGDATPLVVSDRMRAAWAIGTVDMVALARDAGRVIAARDTAVVGERLRAAGRGIRAQWVSAPGAAPQPTRSRLALVAPRVASRRKAFVAAARPNVRSIQKPADSSVSVNPSTIVAYIGRSSSTGAFPRPMTAASQLDRVAVSRELAPWAWAVAYRLRTLSATEIDHRTAHRALVSLSAAADEAFAQAATLSNEQQATELRRAGYALTRRLATWRAEQTATLAAMQRGEDATRLASRDRLAGARWAMSSKGLGLSPGAMLIEPVDESCGRLSTPVLRVAQRLEGYEQRPTSRLAKWLAEDAARLAASEDTDAQRLAKSIEQNYRNANFRVAIAAGLIERMLPQPEAVTSVVRDRIAGTPVSGRATTTTSLGVRLTPDESAWRLGIEAQGLVKSQTVSRGGPARLRSLGSTAFTAKKLVVVTPEGLQAAPAVAQATPRGSRLVGLSTNYDRVPLVGSYVRSAARSEYGKVRSRASSETRVKVEREVRRTLDARTATQLAEMQTRFEQDVVDRAAGLGLRIVPVEMRTTDLRLITRVRVAGASQLAAHTPRMRAPSDSLLSVQMHESMLNNALEGLELAGATLTPEELRSRLVTRLRLPQNEVTNRDKAVLRFASEDPIRFRLVDGRAQMTLSLDSISVRGKRHKNFKVHAFYRPEVNGLVAELVQDGTAHIEGKMRTGSRMHLHGVMGKVLGENRRIALIGGERTNQGKFAEALVGLATNQFVIEDGWIGLAIGPPRSAEGRVAKQVGAYVR